MEKEFADVIFEQVGKIEPENDLAGNFIEYNPRYSGGHPKGLQQHRYGDKTFCRFNIGKHWNVAGVYVLTEKDKVLNVGKTQDLNLQFGHARYGKIERSNCYVGGRVTACKINSLLLAAANEGRGITLWLHRERIEKLRLKIRKRIREAYGPPWNG